MVTVCALRLKLPAATKYASVLGSKVIPDYISGKIPLASSIDSFLSVFITLL